MSPAVLVTILTSLYMANPFSVDKERRFFPGCECEGISKQGGGLGSNWINAPLLSRSSMIPNVVVRLVCLTISPAIGLVGFETIWNT